MATLVSYVERGRCCVCKSIPTVSPSLTSPLSAFRESPPVKKRRRCSQRCPTLPDHARKQRLHQPRPREELRIPSLSIFFLGPETAYLCSPCHSAVCPQPLLCLFPLPPATNPALLSFWEALQCSLALPDRFLLRRHCASMGPHRTHQVLRRLSLSFSCVFVKSFPDSSSTDAPTASRPMSHR